MNVLIRDTSPRLIERILGVVNDSLEGEGRRAEATIESVYFDGESKYTLVIGRRETIPGTSPYYPPPGVPVLDPLPDCTAAPPAVTDDFDIAF